MADPTRQGLYAHAIMFWLLAGMGVVAGVPAVVAPAIAGYQALAVVQQRERQTVEGLERVLERQERINEALRGDPLVNLRLVQRDLGYREPGTWIEVPASGQAIDPALSSTGDGAPRQVALPDWMERLYPHRWEQAYLAERSRRAILIMSITIILCAFALYGPDKSGTPS